MTMTLTYDPELSRVRVAVDGLGDANRVLVERSTNGVTWTTVRGGSDVPVTAGVAQTVDDYEFVPGVVNTYRAIPTLVEGFEAGLVLAVTGTWARTQDQAATGAWSYTTADIGDGQTSDAVVTVPAGATTLAFSWRLDSEEGFDFFRLLIDATPYGSGAAGSFDWVSIADIDVSTATTITWRYEKDGSGSTTADAAWVDDVVFSGFPQQSATITPELATVWIKSLSRPFLNRTVTVTGWSDIERPSRNGVFDIVGRTMPVAVTDVRGSRRYTLTVVTPTPAAADDLDTVLASGDPVLVHVPADCPFPGMYAVIGDIEQGRRSGRGPRRYFTLPLIEVAAPGPDVVGATVTWAGITSAFAAWSDLIAEEATWLDVVERIGDPGEVIVP